ncbi:hypothetical protein C8F01DRAFT_1252582 [Mycena amicta]|nr:hypothetical protein C8F01DRAFT_1252582 [Mycena amicta]
MAAGNPNTLIVMGNSPDSFYVGYGRRHFVQGMSPSFTEHAKTELNVTMTLWVSMSSDLENWVDFNVASDQFHFNGNIDPNIRDHLTGTNGKTPTQFITFPDTPSSQNYFFSKGKNLGSYNCALPTHFIQHITMVKDEVGENFGRALTGVLFGKGKTSVMCFEEGFLAHFDENEVKEEDHPLYKILSEFADGYSIERGSSLCFYDSRFYFLKFRKRGEGVTKMRWNLPVTMTAKLQELQEIATHPEEHAAQVVEDNQWLAVAQRRMGAQMQANDMFNQTIIHAGLSFHAAASGGVIVERDERRYW